MADLPRTRPCVRILMLIESMVSLAFVAALNAFHFSAAQAARNSPRPIQAPSSFKRIRQSVSDHIGVCVHFVAVAFAVGEPVRLSPSIG